ncbi:MAG: CHAT domain-containing protein [Rhodocyclaceae bacterium]
MSPRRASGGRLPVTVLLGALFLFAAHPSSAESSQPWRPEAAHTAILQGAYVDALRQLRAALDGGSDPVRRDALTGLGRLYLALAEPNKARDHLQQARELADRLGEPAARARVRVLQARLDLLQTRYARARESLEQALALATQAGDPGARAEALRWLAELQQREGDSAGSERSIGECLALAQAGKDRAELAFAVAQQAAFHARRADYRQALDLWQQALGGFRALSYAPSEAQAILSLGELNFELGLVGEALPLFEDAFKRFRTLADPVGEVRARIRLGEAYMRLGQAGQALAHAERALEMARKRHDYVGEGEALAQIGELWLEHKVEGMVLMPDPNVALKHFQSAMAIYRDAGDHYAEARTYLKIGAAYLAARQPRVAVKVFEEVARGAATGGDDETLWQALRGQGRALAKVSDYGTAAKRYGEAVEVLERAYRRTAGLDRAARSAFLGDRRGLFEEYLEVLMRLDAAGTDSKATAFAISELARSRQFSEMLAGAGAERAAGRESPRLRELVERERQLRLDYAQITQALIAGRDVAQRQEQATLQTRQLSVRSALEGVQSRIESQFPRYAELAQPRRHTVADVRAALAEGETLLSYFVMGDASVVFVIDRKSFRVVTLNAGRAALRLLVDRFRRPFTELQGIDDLRRWNPESAVALYEAVVAPLAALLPKHGRLIIAGDDALYTLPFEALLTGEVRPMATESGPVFRDYAAWPWFGDRHSIGYVPSAGALLALRKEARAGAWKQTLVAFADPDFGAGSGDEGALSARGGLQGAVLARATGVRGIPRLPETADEVAAVNKILGGTGRIYLRGEASEQQVYQANLSGTRYLMFSTHGLLGGDFSALGQPALALSLVNNPAGIDGFLTMGEVLGIRLDADLTVLSACNTAGEPENARGGEGFAGLTRSFMYAGSRSLVVSHWPVGSQATVALMTAFFQELAAGRAKPVALANARQKLRQTVQQGVQLSHPFFWAPFVLVGDPR